jgi:hypothetical protein
MRRLLSVVVPVSALLVAACTTAASSSSPDAGHVATRPANAGSTGPTPTPGGRQRGTPFTSWPTYHRTTSRSGHATAAVGTPLQGAWSKNLGAAVYGEPLVVGSTLIAAPGRSAGAPGSGRPSR